MAVCGVFGGGWADNGKDGAINGDDIYLHLHHRGTCGLGDSALFGAQVQRSIFWPDAVAVGLPDAGA